MLFRVKCDVASVFHVPHFIWSTPEHFQRFFGASVEGFYDAFSTQDLA